MNKPEPPLDTTDESDAGHFARVEAMARFWLVASGLLWLALGIALSVTEFTATPWPCVLLLALAALHLAAAKWGSQRVALIVTMYFP